MVPVASGAGRPAAEAMLTPLQEILDAYRRTHGPEVRLWQRRGQGWSLVATSAPSDTTVNGPPADAVEIPSARGPETRMELIGLDEAEAEPVRDFLSLVVARVLDDESQLSFFGREIAERYEEITLLYTISEVLGSVISLEQAARTILREVVDTLGVNRAALWIHDEDRDQLELVAAVGGEGHEEPILVGDESSITATVFRDRRPAILEPTDEFPRGASQSEAQHRESFLSVPVSYTPPQGEPRTIGVINLIGRRYEGGFSAGDQKLIAAIASQVGAAVENNRLVAESLRQERTDREMELAHDLQLKLLPSVEQFRDRADVAARCAPADSVGGDFYHLFGLPGGRFGVVIGDVSSHGFAAALIMALTMSAIAIHASEGDPPAEVLRRAHSALIDELENTEMYLTLFYGVIDPRAGRLHYANAGHPHAFVISPMGRSSRLAVTNPPFGIVDLDDYAEEEVPWDPGRDLLFLFTDGLSDSIDRSDGEHLLLDAVARNRDLPLQQLLDTLFDLERSRQGIPPDDRTAVLVRV